jgi:hypothetical protein
VARVATPLIVVGVLVVLIVGAIGQIGPASGPDRRTVDRSFAVLAAPIAVQSNASGSALNAIIRNGASLARTTFFSDLDSITTQAAQADDSFAALSPPQPSADAAGLCGTAMTDRRRAASEVQVALEGLLGGRRGLAGGDEARAVQMLATARTVLQSGDASWAACRRVLRRAPGSAELPVSTWMSDPGIWNDTALGRLASALVSSGTLAPVHRLAFFTFSTDPASVPGASGVSVLPPTTRLRVTVVLADQGNVDEVGVKLVVTAVPQGTTRAPVRVRMSTDIDAGRSQALTPPPLSVRAATSYVLDITATGQEPGAVASATLSLRVAATPPTTTTTTTTKPPAPTTTKPSTTSSTKPPVTSTTVHSG